MLLVVFLTVAAILWLSVFGYVGVLLARVWRRWPAASASPPGASASLPSIAVVVPVRNEERYVLAKLADLRRTDYPAERLRTIVVDGGSTDATATLVETECARHEGLSLVRVQSARGKSEQLNAVLTSLHEDILVVTDADSELDPACLRSLVESLLAHPGTDLVGARIRPATSLLEERIHWWLLGSLWWLEGEALGNGQVSGVCFALRTSAVSALPADCTAEDIRFGLLASARGRDVRLCRHALATELRVPHTAREFITFRRRRGSGYLRELRRIRPSTAPLRWHLVQALRLYHFFVMPPLAAAVTAASLALLATPHWHWPVLAAVSFAVPAAAALFASTTLGEGRRWRLGLAAGRLAGLTWLSLVALPREHAARLVKGGL
jgi:cellulose synthase/poly-beta-1,6-N-acetylglucosamine synthase-like glycosyltransferase